jgi:hypothetical protein
MRLAEIEQVRAAPSTLQAKGLERLLISMLRFQELQAGRHSFFGHHGLLPAYTF